MVGLGSFDLQFTKVYLSSRGPVALPCHFFILGLLPGQYAYLGSQVFPGTGFHDAVVWYACR
jgi:hypothetical protein